MILLRLQDFFFFYYILKLHKIRFLFYIYIYITATTGIVRKTVSREGGENDDEKTLFIGRFFKCRVDVLHESQLIQKKTPAFFYRFLWIFVKTGKKFHRVNFVIKVVV